MGLILILTHARFHREVRCGVLVNHMADSSIYHSWNAIEHPNEINRQKRVGRLAYWNSARVNFGPYSKTGHKKTLLLDTIYTLHKVRSLGKNIEAFNGKNSGHPFLYYCRVLFHLIWQLELGEKNFTGNVWELWGKNLVDITLCDSRIFARFLFHNLKKFRRHHLLILMLRRDQL